MRTVLVFLLTCGAWAQEPAAAPQPATRAAPSANRPTSDYGNLRRYASEDQNVQPPAPGEERVIFMGDSITDFWGRGNNGGTFFPGKPYLNRGISGQMTSQMLLRFYQDVIALKPKVVIVLAGTNDIGSLNGTISPEAIENNFMAMADLARANNIKIIFASLTPVCDYHQPQTERRPPEKIVQLNEWLRSYTARTHLVYLDYFSAMVDDKGMLKAELTADGLHPNAAGYDVMAPLASKAISTALSK